MTPRHSLTASQEDYLETIIALIRCKGVARVRDIAERLAVAKSSVSVALRSLGRQKLVNYKPYELVTLTDRGEREADRILERHAVLRSFLMETLDVNESLAETNACRIEHAMGDAVMQRLRCFVTFMSNSDVPACRLPKAFRGFCAEQRREKRCVDCRAGTASAAGNAAADDLDGCPLAEGTSSATKTLADVRPGARATIRRVAGVSPSVRRMMEMGVTRGAVVQVLRVAPLGDPIEIEVRGYNLTLRREEARQIEVEFPVHDA